MSASHDALFTGGPPEKVERWIGVDQSHVRRIEYRILLFILIGWVPLLDLVLVQNALGEPGAASFAQDFGIHARMLLAIPLLLCAENVCAPRLSSIANRLLTSRVVHESDYERFGAIRRSILTMRDSALAEIAILLLAYALSFAVAWFMPVDALPRWQVTQSDLPMHRSLAGWWHMLVSAPLFLVLVLGWLWRVVLWARFLASVSHLDLRLNASHPDGAAGLGFVGFSAHAFWIVALAFGVVVGGTAANQIVYHGGTLTASVHAFAVLGVVSLALFCGPLLALSTKLLLTWRAGTRDYGNLARDVGERFEARWFAADHRIGPDALDVNDFSATTDLYSIVANVYRMRMVPISFASVVILEVATLAPLLPVALLTTPLDVVLQKIVSFLV